MSEQVYQMIKRFKGTHKCKVFVRNVPESRHQFTYEHQNGLVGKKETSEVGKRAQHPGKGIVQTEAVLVLKRSMNVHMLVNLERKGKEVECFHY